MATRVRRQTNPQGSRQIVRYQQVLTGGLNTDENPGTLPTGSFQELTNLMVSGTRLVALQDELATIDHANTTRTIACCGRGWAKDVQGDYLWEISSADGGTTWALYWYGKSPRYGTYAWLGGTALPFTGTVAASGIAAIPYLNGLMISGGERLVYAVSRVYDSGLGYNLGGFDYIVMNAAAPVAPTLNPVDPDNALTWAVPDQGIDTTDRLFYLLVTIAEEDADGNVLWESLPVSIEDSLGNAVTLSATGTTGEPDEWTNASLYLNALNMTLDGNSGTHFRVYRTLDVGPVAVTNTDFDNASAQSYRLIVNRAIPALGYTTIAFNTDADAMLFSDSDLVIFNAEVYAGQLREPMPVGTAGVLAYSDGYLWTAEDATAYHSEAAAWPRFAGYYFTGSASPIVERAGVTAIYASDGYALVCTSTSIRRVSTQNVLEFGTALGIYGTVFQYTPYVTQDWGVRPERRQACDVVGSEVVLFCSDHQVRIYSGSAMGEPVSAGKVSKTLRGIAGTCYSVYSPEGYWHLSWSSTGSGACDTALRLSLGESGRPWCKVDWGDDNAKPFYLPTAFFATGAPGAYSGIIRLTAVGDGGAVSTTYSLYSMTSFSDSVKDLDWAISSPQYGGEYDGYVVRHEETTLTVNGTFAEGSFAILADATADEPYGQRRAYAERIALAGTQVEAPLAIARTIQNIRWCAIRLTGTDTTRFELTKLMSILSAQDRPFRNSTVLALVPGNADRMRMTPCSGILASQEAVSGAFAEVLNGTVSGTVSGLPTPLTPSVGPIYGDGTITPPLLGTALAPTHGSCVTLETGLSIPKDEAWSVLAGMWLYLPNLCEELEAASVIHSILAIGDLATVRIKGWDDGGVETAELTLVSNATGAIIGTVDLALDATKSRFVRIEVLLSNDGSDTYGMIGAAYSTNVDTAALAWVDSGLDEIVSGGAPAPSSVIAFGGFARWKDGVLVPAEKAGIAFVAWDLSIGSLDEATTAAEFRDTGYLYDIRNNRGETYRPGIILR